MIIKVLLYTSADDLSHSKKHKDWTILKNFLLPPFFFDLAIVNIQASAAEKFNLFVDKSWLFGNEIKDKAAEIEDDDIDKGDNETNSVRAANVSTLYKDTIFSNCDGVLAFLKVIA